MRHLLVILHQDNFAENGAVGNLNPMIEICDDDVGKWNQKPD